MNKQERKVMEMALEALENADYIVDMGDAHFAIDHADRNNLITSIRQAFAQPEQKLIGWKDGNPQFIAQPEQKTVPLADYKKLSQLCTKQGIRLMDLEDEPEQEPVWCGCGDGIVADDGAKCGVCVMQLENQIKRLKTQPEHNFCQRCGKRLGDGVHTCTPLEQEPYCWVSGGSVWYRESLIPRGKTVTELYTAPPKRDWQGLTDDDREILEAVRRELDRQGSNGDAPGHSHSSPGIWDSDNGLRAGKPCAWCLTWKKFKNIIHQESLLKEKS